MSLKTGRHRVARVQSTLLFRNDRRIHFGHAVLRPVIFQDSLSSPRSSVDKRNSVRHYHSTMGLWRRDYCPSPGPTSSGAASRALFRTASTSTSTSTSTAGSNTQTRTASTTSPPLTGLGPLPPSASSRLNPPSTTRPPPLDLPSRDRSSSLIRHLFGIGNAYVNFYKSGLKAVFTNRRLVRDLSSSTPPPGLPHPPTLSSSLTSASSSAEDEGALTKYPTRAEILLRSRTRHDLSRLPLFGLIILVCGEFTPLVVLLFPKLTPYTCRIPAQTSGIRRKVEERRAASYRALQTHISSLGEKGGSESLDRKIVDGHIARALSLTSPLWDRVGLASPFAASLVSGAIGKIVEDDALIRREREDGRSGVDSLVDDEVVLACEDRGMDVRDRPARELRARLGEWIEKTAPTTSDSVFEEAARREAEDKTRHMFISHFINKR